MVERLRSFQEDWLARVQELIDKYQPQDFIYFDNGVNPRVYGSDQAARGDVLLQ